MNFQNVTLNIFSPPQFQILEHIAQLNIANSEVDLYLRKTLKNGSPEKAAVTAANAKNQQMNGEPDQDAPAPRSDVSNIKGSV